MAEPGIYDLVIRRGEDFTKTIEILNKSGLAVNLTGYRGLMQIRQRPWEGSPLFTTLSDANGGISFPIPRSQGKVKIFIQDDATAVFYWLFGYYDLLLTAGGSDLENYYLQGTVRIDQRITVGP